MKRIANILLFLLCATVVLLAQSTAPNNMTNYRGKNGKSYLFYVTGSNSGRFWGGQNNVYTDDSPIGLAAVHAGLLKPGETKVIQVTVMAGRSSYPSITRNGLTSIQYGSWDGSYQVSAASQDEVVAAPDNMKNYRGRNGQVYTFRVTGKNNGRIWGGQNNIYTDDSDIATAAVHAGKLRTGQRGDITIKVLAGRSSYPSITRNGLTSIQYGSWDGSYQVSAAPKM